MQAVQKNAHNGKVLLLMLAMLLNAALQPRNFAVTATEDVANVSPCELESIINQLVNPSPDYQLHASALRNQLKNILRERQLAVGEEQSLGEYDYTDEDKRSVASLAAQGMLHAPAGSAKRSFANLAKNGQLPSFDAEDYAEEGSSELGEQKRNIGALARGGGVMSFGKRNVGTLARDFQLPNGKRNLATMARLGMLQSAPGTHRDQPKRNVAAVARYNSQQHPRSVGAEKRNLGALKGSPVHGAQQKREDEEMLLPAAAPDFADSAAMPAHNYWWYPNYAGYADLDWNEYRRAEKRFLDTSKDSELFGIENGSDASNDYEEDFNDNQLAMEPPQKRHIGAVYRSGFLPTYRYLRSPTAGYGSSLGGGSGRFSRSGRARQFVEYFPQQERLRQPTAAVCKRCFLPNRPMINWNSAGIRGRQTTYHVDPDAMTVRSIATNSLPAGASTARAYPPFHAWGTPPRITALHRREFRRINDNEPMNNYKY